jgi:hypothetical protein
MLVVVGNPGPAIVGDGVVTSGVASIGLSPGPTISVELRGMPTRPVARAGGMAINPVPFGIDVVVPGSCPHPADPVLATPPPSNSAVAGGTPGVPPVEQPGAAGGGLMPGVASSVAARGMPTGPTDWGMLVPMVPLGVTKVWGASSDGTPVSSICANAQPQAKKAAAAVPTIRNLLMTDPPRLVAVLSATADRRSV